MCARSYIISWMYHFLFRSCWLLSVAYKPSVCVGWSECGAAYSYRTFCISSLVVVTSTAVYWLLHHHLIFLSILLTPRYCVYTAFTSFYTSLSSSLTHPPTHSLSHTFSPACLLSRVNGLLASPVINMAPLLQQDPMEWSSWTRPPIRSDASKTVTCSGMILRNPQHWDFLGTENQALDTHMVTKVVEMVSSS